MRTESLSQKFRGKSRLCPILILDGVMPEMDGSEPFSYVALSVEVYAGNAKKPVKAMFSFISLGYNP